MATKASNADADCVLLEWDSRFFGRQIGRLRNRNLTPRVTEQALTWAKTNGIDCLYFLADANDRETTVLAESQQFHQTDIRVTLEGGLQDFDAISGAAVRAATEEDLPALRELAATSHRDGRFYYDPHFDRALCDKFYATWLENSFRGYAKGVLVADEGSGPVGYVTCDLRDDPRGRESQIGLIAVAERARGAGLGKLLVAKFLEWSRQHGAEKSMVVTQGRNVSAQRLYQSCGFRTRCLELWYHRWFE